MKLDRHSLSLSIALSGLLLGGGLVGCDTQGENERDPNAASACAPQDEECALLDADGDGVVNSVDDFPLDNRCQHISQESCETCNIACAAGLICQRNVVAGQFRGGLCVVADVESCNELDDDGDGVVDEGPPSDNQRGVCGGSRMVCSSASVFVNPEYGAIPGYVDGGELCDGLDNDCDGFVDETPRALKILGVCQGLSQVCVDGAFQEPDYEGLPDYSEVERCDGLDNDCDGEIDEGIPGVGIACGAGVGACFEEGVTLCEPIARRVVCSVNGGAPSAEACNGRDDDCDGRVDEQLPNAGMSCVVGQGSCAVEGRLICADETGALICDATPDLPERESCNGVDDDCDGVIDEDSLGVGEGCQVGVGACSRFGQYICDTLSNQLVCSQEPSEPIAESCNGVDDDCDGRIDEEVPTVGDGCSIGRGRCLSQGAFACDSEAGEVICDAEVISPVAEECNDVDDDCDGDVDENAIGAGEACEAGIGACRRESALRCDSERRELVCDAVAGEGSAESCNDIDDDCDGATDEGDIVRLDVENNIEWICVRGGDFLMGWNERINERPIHPVRVDTFEVARTESTVAQYSSCILANVCDVPINIESNWNIPGRLTHPINALSWYEAQNYASFVGARLPTEAEWEYLARFGHDLERYPWGDATPTCDYAHFSDPTLGDGCGEAGSAPVCSRSPLGDSVLGLCDLSGNVSEWVEDGYSVNYNNTPQDGSAAEGEGASKLVRGGSWRSLIHTITSTYRLEASPSVRFDNVGVRLVKSISAE